MTAAFVVRPHARDLRPKGRLVVSSVSRNPPDSGKYSLDLFIEFSPKPTDNEEEQRFVSGLDGQPLVLNYRVKEFAFTPLMTKLHQAVAALLSQQHRFPVMDRDSDPAILGDALQPLARFGYQVYSRLFHLSNTPNYSSEDIPRGAFDLYGRLLRKWLATVPSLDIIGPRHLIPWPMLYPDKDHEKAVQVELFWGFSKSIQLISNGLAKSREIHPNWRLATGVDGFGDGLYEGAQQHQEPDHPFSRHRDRLVEIASARELFCQLAHSHMLYHYGHALTSARGFAFGGIRLGNTQFDASDLEELLTDEAMRPLAEPPLLVFLNGCSSVMTSGAGESIPEVLVKHAKARVCFVATVGAVPAWAAAMFAKRFFLAFLGADGIAPRTLGESLMQARRDMLALHHSPIGLMYVAYGWWGTGLRGSASTVTASALGI